MPINLNDADSLIQTCEGRKPYNLLHLNALYDLQAHTYVDAIVQKKHASSENGALTNMVDRSEITGDVILILTGGMNLIITWRISRKKAGNILYG